MFPHYYQGHLQSTSERIEKVFFRAIEQQKQFRQKHTNNVSLVIIDEIGLAEISPFNPLKVLHSLLETNDKIKQPRVSFVGISNWSLDASKMNRALNLSRTDLDQKQLVETALSIYDEIKKNLQIQKDLTE